MRQRIIGRVGDRLDVIAALKRSSGKHGLERLVVDPFHRWRRTCQQIVGIGPEAILVQLHPQIVQAMWRLIVIGDRLGARQTPFRVVQFDRDDVVSALLPVLRTRFTRSQTRLCRRGKNLVELTERIGVVAKILSWQGWGCQKNNRGKWKQQTAKRFHG